MTPARALERAVALPNDANLANDRRRRHRSASARARETRDGRSGTRARAIADGESKREDANAANAAEDAIEASRGVTSTVSATVRRTRAIAGMLEGKDEKVAEAELKALTSRAANETSSLLEDLAPYARPSEDAAWEDERFAHDAEQSYGGEHDLNVGPFTMNFRGNDLLVDAMLKVAAGRRYGLVGKNGCGKTTFIDILAGRKSTGVLSGTVSINGEPLSLERATRSASGPA